MALGEGRVSSSLKQNFATYYRIPVTGGYDTDSLEQYLPETAAARSLIATDLMRFLREYGVEHVTYYRLNHQGDTISSTEEKSMRKIASVSEERPDLITHTIGDKATTKPMAYCQSEPSEGLQYAIVGNGVDILTPSRTTASVLVANFLHRHWFTAHTTDGKTLRPSRIPWEELRSRFLRALRAYRFAMHPLGGSD